MGVGEREERGHYTIHAWDLQMGDEIVVKFPFFFFLTISEIRYSFLRILCYESYSTSPTSHLPNVSGDFSPAINRRYSFHLSFTSPRHTPP